MSTPWPEVKWPRYQETPEIGHQTLLDLLRRFRDDCPPRTYDSLSPDVRVALATLWDQLKDAGAQ